MNCFKCKYYKPNSIHKTACPFVRYVSYYDCNRQVFPHIEKWDIYKDYCTRYIEREEVSKRYY